MGKRRYQQQCGVARALDLLGDRWTLLVIRDLCAGPQRFGALQRGLPSMGANLLSARLGALVDAGILVHTDGAYALSAQGQALRPLLRQLMALGKFFDAAVAQDGDDSPVPARTAMAVLFDPLAARQLSLVVDVCVGDEHFSLYVSDGCLRTGSGAALVRADVVLEATVAGFNGAAHGRVHESDFRLRGSAGALAAFRRIFSLPVAPLHEIVSCYEEQA